MQPVDQVFPELALLSVGPEVPVGGGDHPDVNADGAHTAHPFQFALLEDA